MARVGVRNLVRRPTIYRRAELCREAIDVIELRFHDETLSLDAVAAEIATSTRQLQRALAEVGRTSFRREVQRVRMEHAMRLLQDGSRPVKEVATAVGYRHAAQFTKAFRRHYGSTPSSVQESGREERASRRNTSPRPRGLGLGLPQTLH
jgi:AraC-like DNA-binding protein